MTFAVLFSALAQVSDMENAEFKEPEIVVLELQIEEGICYFNGIKIGAKLADIESRLGTTNLTSNDDEITHLFYPGYGLRFGMVGDYVREIELFPNPGSEMGDVLRFKIFSRNQYMWMFRGLKIRNCQPQDIMTTVGTDNLTTKLGVGFAGSINDTMTYNVVNSGGTQQVVFYFIDSEELLNHIENRLDN